MASSSSSEGGTGSGGSGGRRYPRNLEGILRFSTENTGSVTEDASGTLPSNLTAMDPESIHPNPTTSYGNPPTNAASAPNDPELARINQDRALTVLGLHRYRVAGDGNCLFRAVAWHLKFDQQKYHPILRKAAVKWMRENKDELLEWGLLDSVQEIDETEELGVWPGQAAIVALANIFSVNIAVIQGGDKGDIDIQHICPFETATANGEKGSVILAYLYNGHYDAIVEQPNMENPEFDAWTIRRDREREADEALAWKLAAEEGYNGSAARPIIDMKHECEGDEALARRLMEEEFHNGSSPALVPPVRDLIQHVSDVQVSSQTKPLEQVPARRENPLVIPVHSDGPLKGSISNKPSRPTLPRAVIHTNIPERPTRPPPRKSMSEDVPQWNEESRIKLTLYPKKQHSFDEDLDSKRSLYKPTAAYSSGEPQLRVTRRTAENDLIMQRRLQESKLPVAPARTRSPSIRVIPIQFVGRVPQRPPPNPSTVTDRQDLDRRPAMKRREYAERSPNSSWSQTSSSEEYYDNDRERFHQTSVQPRQQPAVSVPSRHQTYSSVSDPARPRMASHEYRTDYSVNEHNLRVRTPSSTLSKHSASGRDGPVVVLSARPPRSASAMHTRATPAPATYDLNMSFDMPPQLRPYRSAFDSSDMKLRCSYWQ